MTPFQQVIFHFYGFNQVSLKPKYTQIMDFYPGWKAGKPHLHYPLCAQILMTAFLLSFISKRCPVSSSALAQIHKNMHHLLFFSLSWHPLRHFFYSPPFSFFPFSHTLSFPWLDLTAVCHTLCNMVQIGTTKREPLFVSLCCHTGCVMVKETTVNFS